MAALVFGAIGVVFGDIGTSPLYTMKETLRRSASPGTRPAACPGRDVADLLGPHAHRYPSKYLIVVMRADNQGEGGILALLALLKRVTGGRPGDRVGWSPCSPCSRPPSSTATA